MMGTHICLGQRAQQPQAREVEVSLYVAHIFIHSAQIQMHIQAYSYSPACTVQTRILNQTGWLCYLKSAFGCLASWALL